MSVTLASSCYQNGLPCELECDGTHFDYYNSTHITADNVQAPYTKQQITMC